MNGRRVVSLVAVLLLVLLSATPTSSAPGTPDASGADELSSPANLVQPPADESLPDEFSAVHETGITGEGVRVGVVGARFDLEGSPVADHVAGVHRFTDRRSPQFGDTSTHGTAVAEVVAQTAPDAKVYLASVGAQPTAADYAAAVDWLLAQGVDVVVDAGSYFSRTGASVGEFARVANRATEQGVVFVTSAGNYANRHWGGTVRGGGWVSFADQVQANPLGNGSISGRVTLRLSWESATDYDLYLYRFREDARDPVVAKSVDPQQATGAHVEAIDVVVPPGRYYVAVYAQNASGSSRLDLFTARHRLRYTSAMGSMLAPATAPSVIAVGAVESGGTLASYSSRGDTLDVAAPATLRTDATGRFTGTSAAAPLVAGTIALMESRHGDLTPAEAERILEVTADRSGDVLRLDPAAAVAAAERADAAAEPRANNSTPTDPVFPDRRLDSPTDGAVIP